MNILNTQSSKTYFPPIILVMSILSFAFQGTVNAKSLYVISNINASPTPIQAYDIQPASPYLVYQATHNVPYHGGGGVGITIDTDSKYLFVTYEFENIIELIDATTMTSAGITIAPGATNLAGIVVDQGKKLVYTVDRETNNLYIYVWDAISKTLTLDHIEPLANITSAHGIALDEVNGLLFVADRNSKIVRYFRTSDWTEAGNFTVTQVPAGIAVDVIKRLVYTGNPQDTYGGMYLLSKYDLNTGIETTIDIRTLTGIYPDNVVGLSVDQTTSLLYITTGDQWGTGSDRLMVFDSNLNLLKQTGDIGDPTGLCIPGKQVSYNPLNLAKNGIIVGSGIYIGSQFTYEVTCDNSSNPTQAATNVTLTDNLPAELDFVSATNGGSYQPGTHKVLWNIGTIPAGAAGPKIELVVKVNSNAQSGQTIYNYCTISADGIPPTTVIDQDPNDPNDEPGTPIVEIPQEQLELIGLEVVQSVQDWKNTVPLIQGKTTYVRAHLRSKVSVPVKAKARLRGFRNGVEFADSPLTPNNTGEMVEVTAKTDRAVFADSLNFRLPLSWISDKVKLQIYVLDNSIEFMEEAGPNPNDGNIEVTFVPTAKMKVKLVEMRWLSTDGLHYPTKSDQDAIEKVALDLQSIYPISTLDWTSGTSIYILPLNADQYILRAVNLIAINAALGAIRALSGDWDRFYYGVVSDLESGVVGISLGMVACGNEDSAAHEIGHSLGRPHAVSKEFTPWWDLLNKNGVCGESALFTVEDFPYFYDLYNTGNKKPTMGPMDLGQNRLIYGFRRNWFGNYIIYEPLIFLELMSYCRPKWISDHTYKAIRDAINDRYKSSSNGVTSFTLAYASRRDYLLVRGIIDLQDDVVEFLPFLSASTMVSPPPIPIGSYFLDLRDSEGNSVELIPFKLDEGVVDTSGAVRLGTFVIPVAASPSIKQLVVYHDANMIGSLTASINPPEVHLVFPNGGENLDGNEVNIMWTGSDVDGDTLTYTVQYSEDGGSKWETLAVDFSGTNLMVERSFLAGTSNGLIRVMASDGFNTASDESDSIFTVINNKPILTILSPNNQDLFTGTQQIFFEAMAQDREDGTLEGNSIRWESSLDGLLGNGTLFNIDANTLSEGKHKITSTVTDSAGASALASVTIRVVRVYVEDATAPVVDIIIPDVNQAVQDGITLTAEVNDVSKVDEVKFYIREPNYGNGIPIGKEGLSATFNNISGKWEYNFDTTQVPDGYYIALARAEDIYWNVGWSEVVPFSIRNWAISPMLPSTPNSKAGRTMPVKFSLRIARSVDPKMPFIDNDELEIRIYDHANPSVILQSSIFGSGSTNYRIDMGSEKYITNFKTKNAPATYVVEIWRPAKNFMVGSFTFATTK